MQWNRSRLARAAAVATLAVFTAVVSPSASAPAQAAASSGFLDHLNGFDTRRWHKANGWSNGGVFNAGWRADHIRHSGGVMAINLDTATCPSGCSAKPYASGEYRTNAQYSYGRFEVRMKAVKRPGTVTSFFTYTGPSDGQPWDEIDVEILGRNTTQMQTNYYTDGVGGHESVIDLGFDASTGFHNYAIEWRESTIKWFVDGRLVHQEDGSRGPLPSHPQRIMVNLWPGIGVDEWLGPFTYPGRALTARYEWIRYTQY
ncbi:glycoside hydrolase family 16 protein [Kineosporia rhizophila]|uniref:beta-glucanase n=1 Tax=Kineosporia rhizophila TaxID=84633 RepID=UPI001E5B7FF2|nr:glycoside hydrolase family 16 protein [Kineosporia rhizophila]